MGDENSAIFLTGATGLVGGLLLRRLVEEFPTRPIFALVRDCRAAATLPPVHLLKGDITEPRLGLSTGDYTQLCTSTGVIVHCAASTRFTLPLEESRRVNVEGTANILALARCAPRLQMLLHVSSTFVAGKRTGNLREEPLLDPAGWFSPYEQSKFEAEQLLLDQAAGLPWAIARISTLAGHSQTGHVTQFNYFHQLLRTLPYNSLPLIPGEPDARIDIVPDDWVAEALLALLRDIPPLHSVLHLCAGPSQSVPAQELLEMAFALHRRGRPASRAVIPTFVSPAEFQTFLADLQKKGSERLCRIAELVLLCMPHLDLQQDFLNANTTTLLARSGVNPIPTRVFLPRIMQQWL